MFKVNFINQKKVVDVEEGSTIQDAAIEAGIILNFPCGGLGMCRKCSVKVNGQIVLACLYKINEDLEVESNSLDKMEIVT